MHYNNKTEKYYFYTYNQKDELWRCSRIFNNKQELISFLADNVVRYKFDLNWNRVKTDNTNLWHSPHFDFLSMNDNDMLAGNVVVNRMGNEFTLMTCHSEHRYYRFYDSDWRIIDVRDMKNEIYDYIHAKDAKLIPPKKFKSYHWNKHYGHKCTHYRTSSHLYTRFLNTHDEYDEEFDYKFKSKPKDRFAKYMWRDDFWTSGETGWKTKKNKKQWMHRVNKNNNAWVDKTNYKSLAYTEETNEN